MTCFAAKHCQLDLFSLNKIFFAFSDLRIIITGGKCAVSEREICMKAETNGI